MGLHPLEFSDCIVDSPQFRDKLHQHEKELERTSKSMKSLITDGKELLMAAKSLSKAQRAFSKNLLEFKFETIGEKQTDDEIIIADSLKEVGRLIADIEDERDRLLDQAFSQFLPALENFRKDEIGAAKESKKRFDKQTAKFCASLERYLALKANKSSEVSLQEADAALEMERTAFYQQSMNHVLLLQQVQEKKKFEFVEVLLTFVYSWLAFYHQGQEVYKDFKPYMTDLQFKLQKMRESFEAARQQAEELMNRTLEKKHEPIVMKNKEGYLFLMEKKALSTNWVKHYCRYLKDTKQLQTVPYTQTGGGKLNTSFETLTLTSCTRRAAETIDKRFCFDITVADRPGTITLQALNEEDRRSWLDIMDGKEPIYQQPQTSKAGSSLDDAGFLFITKCISALDSRGLDEQGLYRVVGVNSKVQKLTQLGLDRKKVDKLNLDEEGEYEIKTITSAIKNYFRSLPEPLMTFEMHNEFMLAAKHESKTLRVHDIHVLVHRLPEVNYRMLHILMRHLKKVSDNQAVNLMSVANLAVCFGPTLMRPHEETLAAIIDIKFCNVIVEILITNYDKIFNTSPDGPMPAETRLRPQVPKPERMSASFPSDFMTSSVSSMTSSMSSSTQSIDDARTLTPTASTCPELTSPRDVMMTSQTVTSPQKSPVIGVNQNERGGQVAGGERFGAGLSPVQRTRPGSVSAYPATGNGSGQVTGSGVVLRPSHQRSASSASADNVDNPILAARRGLRSVIGHPAAPDLCSSTSSSSESLNSKTSTATSQSVSSGNTVPGSYPNEKRQVPVYSSIAKVQRASHYESSAPVNIPRKAETTSATLDRSSGNRSQLGWRKVRTLYACQGDNASELTFEPNEIIHNVRTSKEVGWLEGTLRGRTGLIPANYVEFLN